MSGPTLRARVVSFAVAVVAVGVLVSGSAGAHFILHAPASWMSQDSLGSPQKLGPCGNEGGGTTTGLVSACRSGQQITITIEETVFHPGHYRVALATDDRSQLPPEPLVTQGSTPCGTVPIESPAVFPVLADGVLVHTAPFSGPQSFTVTLPADVTCTKCTLQVIEFMSDHGLNMPGGCFYHHCADLSLSTTVMDCDSGGAPVDAGETADAETETPDAEAPTIDAAIPSNDAGAQVTDSGAHDAPSESVSPSPSSSSCGCSAVGMRNPIELASLGLLGLGVWILRRRRPSSE